MTIHPEDDTGALERARERLYGPGGAWQGPGAPRATPATRALPHEWEERPLVRRSLFGRRRVRFAGIFFAAAFFFFLISLGIAGYFLYFGGNAVSIDKIAIDIQGPTTIAGGDTVPLMISITNKNSVAIENATIEIDFPDGTRNATNVANAYPRYTEDLGTIESGASVLRSVKVMLFGGAGQALTLPVSFSFGTAASNATFVKKSSYALAISSAPLSVSIDAPTAITAGTPFTIALTARSSATVPLSNVVLSGALPFGFSVISSSVPMTDSSFLLGTLAPGASKKVTLTGTLFAQGNEQRVFHFTIGTAKTAGDSSIAVAYLTQDATVAIAAPFIATTLAINGDTSDTAVITPGNSQTVSVSYTNTLTTSVSNVVVAVAIAGSAVDYTSIQASNGFYRSADHTIVFSRDTDPALAALAPGASGTGAFTFSTLAPGALGSSPTITFTASASGTYVGQTSAAGETSVSTTKAVKVATVVALSSSSLHATGPFGNSGPIPPHADQATTYTITWNVQNTGNAVADGTVSALLPSYVSYTGLTTAGFSYDSGSRSVLWHAGDLAQNASAQGSFQVSLVPSTSQKGNAPTLVGGASFSGHDRFTGVAVSATADAVTTETKTEPGSVSANSVVQ